jgi:hypothetical protein
VRFLRNLRNPTRGLFGGSVEAHDEDRRLCRRRDSLICGWREPKVAGDVGSPAEGGVCFDGVEAKTNGDDGGGQ